MNETSSELEAYFDGACEPYNPGGNMGMGFVVLGPTGIVTRGSRGMPKDRQNTNNRAEWYALIDLLAWMRDHPEYQVSVVYGDSQLVINQIEGRWKVRTEHLVVLHRRAKELMESIPYFVKFKWTSRAGNILADTQSKLAVTNLVEENKTLEHAE